MSNRGIFLNSLVFVVKSGLLFSALNISKTIGTNSLAEKFVHFQMVLLIGPFMIPMW